jgi:lipid-A-disaccharide synthase
MASQDSTNIARSQQDNKLTIMLVAGEASGDFLGGQLMTALQSLHDGEIFFSGVGGPAMTRQGLSSLFDFDQIALMGISQIIRNVPYNPKRIRIICDHALETQPDVVVLIDSSEFNQWVAEQLKNRKFLKPIVKFVSPQVWGSRPNRIFKIASAYDHVLTLLPFEPEYYQKVSLPATYVGHPVTERIAETGGGPSFRKKHGIPEDATLVCVLPGSRRSEIKYMMPVFSQTIEVLTERIPSLVAVVPTLPSVHDRVASVVETWPVESLVVMDEREKFAAFDASTVALAASGTVSLELAIARVPMVIGYKIGWLSALVYRRLLLVRYITLANLILGREVVPEFVQEKCQAQPIADELERLLRDDDARRTQLALLDTVVKELLVEGEKPSVRAAKTLLEIAGVEGFDRCVRRQS